MTRSASSKVPIVFLAIASSEVERTRDLKALEQEHRELQEQYEEAQHEGRCQLIDRFAVTLDGFFDVFRDTANAGRIKVLHFAGHAGDEVLVMETENGQQKLVGAAGLAEFLSTKPGLHLVFLNGCHTQAQIANLHAAGIPVVIATTEEVEDEHARIFACNFHAELSKGSSINTAFGSASGALRAARHGNTAVSNSWILSAPNEQDRQWSMVSDLRPSAPCRMLFPKNNEFVGREEDLRKLHRALLGNNAVGIQPAGLTGLGGIGKTQLAVEYCYLHQSSYPAGIFWINAAQNWSEQFAELGMLLVPGLAGEPQIRQVQAATDYFRTHHDCLLVIDNVADPEQLRRTIKPDLVLSSLPCHLLFTTRRRDLGGMSAVEVTFLPLDPALQLLLRANSRQPVLDLDHPEHADACAIYRMLGGLPLALEIAGAFLTEWPEISVSDFRQRLHREGRLATLDAESEDLSFGNLSGLHEAAVAATLGEQWDSLGTGKEVDEDARLLLRIAGQLAEGVQIPAARLKLLAGLTEKNALGRPSRLDRALRRLENASLIEVLQGNELRLHPLVHEFANRHTTEVNTPAFRRACAERLLTAYRIIGVLEKQCADRGVDALRQDIADAMELIAADYQAEDLSYRLRRLLRMVQRETQALLGWNVCEYPAYFLQQWRKRALIEGMHVDAQVASDILRDKAEPYFEVQWSTAHESSLLEYTLNGHMGPVNAVEVTQDGRRGISASDDYTLKVWDLTSGQELQTLSGHSSMVQAVAITPDGKKAVSASWDKTLNVWDLQNGRKLHTLRGHTREVVSVAVTPDGKKVVSASWGKTLNVWDLQNGRKLHTLRGHKEAVNSVRVTADGRWAVSASADGTLKLWDLQSGRELRTLIGHSNAVRAVTMTPDGYTAVSASADHTLRVWDLQTGRELHTLNGHTAEVCAVAVTSDGRTCVSASADHSLRVWDLQTGRELQTLNGHTAEVCAVSVMSDGRKCVSASADHSLKVWNLQTGHELQTLNGHTWKVDAVAVTADGRRVISASGDYTVKVWDLQSTGEQYIPNSHKGWVRAVAVTPDGRTAVSASNDRTLKVLDLESGHTLHTLRGHTRDVVALAVMPDGRKVVSASEDSRLKIWDLQNGHELNTLGGHKGVLYAVAVAIDGRKAVSASGDGTLKVWDLQSGRELHALSGHTGGVRAVAVTLDGRRTVSASDDGTLKVWDLQSGRQQHTLDGHDGIVWAVAVTPDGRRAVSASEDCRLKVWDLQTGIELHTLVGHKAWVVATAVTPDGRTVVSASWDKTLIVWDLEKGQELHTLSGHTSPVHAVAVTPNGRWVISASHDRTLKIWDLLSGRCVASICLDESLICLTLVPNNNKIVVGDVSGAVHCLNFQSHEEADECAT